MRSSQTLKLSLYAVLTVALAACGTTSPRPNVQPSTQPIALQKTNPANYKSQTPTRWFVELETPSSATGDFSSQSALSAQSSFRSLARGRDLKYTELYSYSRLFSGLSIKATSGTLAEISALPGVKAIYPVGDVQLTPREARAVTGQAPLGPLDQTGASTAQSELGLSGKGIRVGIIDTGLDVDHPAFKNRIVAQYDFVGPDYGKDNLSLNVPGESADDKCEGHGTHVAGIVGANTDRVKGVAPEVSFGIYKVFGCKGGAPYDAILAALERAAADKMQVVNLSLGGFGGVAGPFSKAMDRLADQGVVVVKSAGNSGGNGTFSTDADNDSDKIISVSSFENVVISRGKLTTKPSNSEMLFASSSVNQYLVTGLSDVVATGSPSSGADGCKPLAANSLKGKIALIRRGSCTFQVKADNAQVAGAIAVLLFNRPDATGVLSPSTDGKLPIGMITYDDGVKLYQELQKGAVQVDVAKDAVNIANPGGNLLSDFSSFGPTNSLKFKPDLGAPGGQILSTFPLELGGYAVESGTSMSAPHVAGLVALMLQANPKLKPDEIRTLLMNNAVPQLYAKDPSLKVLDSVQQQGAGMADVVRSLSAKVTATPSALSLGDSVSGQAKQTLTLKNTGTQAVTYALSREDAVNTQGTFEVSPNIGETQATFAPSSVTVPAGGSATVEVTLTAPDAQFDDSTIYGGYVVLTSSASTLRVPYVGFKGDFKKVEALTFGDLLYVADDKPYPQKANSPFDLLADEFPTLAFQLAYPVKRMEIDILDGSTYLPVYPKGHWAVSDGLGRNEDSNYNPASPLVKFVYTFPWDGSLKAQQQLNGVPVTKTMPNGQYVFKVRVLKMTGDAANLADWENYTSVPFFLTKSTP